MNHMAPTGVRGLDLYAWVDGGWRFVNCARPGSGKTTESRIVSDMVPEEREYMLYLPLYDGIDSLSIGVDSCAMIGAPRLSYPVREHPIVFLRNEHFCRVAVHPVRGWLIRISSPGV